MSNSEQLRNDMLQSMRRLASSVSVVTAVGDNEKHAMAATSVTSLSMDPPSLLVCVNKSTGMHQALDNGGDFVINVLGNDQQEVSAACGGKLKGEERFTVGNWTETTAGLPYLKDAQSVVVLEQDGRYEYGTHTIFIGKVKEIKNSDDVNPLLYVDGRYASVEAAEA
ncbi:flavin reductase [Endozoicomonas sp. OPT23]|uniref:flavin reductase family protein n=1 Tax=Endozoicomonas sp. OPT23 TaxID=2072845 RepID=UPI00129BFDE2|nr:flavin reductase family protein [Endozoicomonas sp. OPT23]MRI34026.1 flavin reductase [Endozoicomonas sp. OPT23]